MSTAQQSDVTIFPAVSATVEPPPLPRSIAVKRTLGLVAKEALAAVMIYFLCGALLKPLFGSLAVIVSGGSSEIRSWGIALSFVIALACYGFGAGRSAEKHRLWRIGLQTVFQLGLLTRAFRDLSGSQGIAIGAVVSVFLLFALLGSLFTQPKREEKKQDKNANKEAANFVVHIIMGIGIFIGIELTNTWLSGYAQDMMYLGHPAPATMFTKLDGETWSLSEQQGKVVLIEFWSPNCGPCLAAFPHLKQIHQRYKDRTDFEMVSVNAGSNTQKAEETFKRYEAGWPLLQPPATTSPKDLQPDFVPSAFIVDADGKIVAASIRSAAIDRKLDQLLGTEQAAN